MSINHFVGPPPIASATADIEMGDAPTCIASLLAALIAILRAFLCDKLEIRSAGAYPGVCSRTGGFSHRQLDRSTQKVCRVFSPNVTDGQHTAVAGKAKPRPSQDLMATVLTASLGLALAFGLEDDPSLLFLAAFWLPPPWPDELAPAAPGAAACTRLNLHLSP